MAARRDYDHKRLAAVLGEAATGEPVPPTLAVKDRISLDLGGRVLELTAWPSAHTGDDLTVLDRCDAYPVGRRPAFRGAHSGPGWQPDRLARGVGQASDNRRRTGRAGAWAGLGALAGGCRG